MKYYIISGEPSGDLYGSYLIESLMSLDQQSTFFCWGGDNMKKKEGRRSNLQNNHSIFGFGVRACKLLFIK